MRCCHKRIGYIQPYSGPDLKSMPATIFFAQTQKRLPLILKDYPAPPQLRRLDPTMNGLLMSTYYTAMVCLRVPSNSMAQGPVGT